MHYVRFGSTGMKVSRLCLGCMTYGVPERGKHAWTLPEEVSRPYFKQAIEAGINFFDTANSYSDGTSEEITGRALRDFARREEIVVATKVFHPWGSEGPNMRGLSRKAIMTAIDASLTRLGMDYVDLYQIHRWDYDTPIEETLEALHDVVKAGKARYIGASSMHAWQFCKALSLSHERGWARFVSMQPYYNVMYREEEREMLKLCAAEGIAVIPWSPLARGKLARPWSDDPPTDRDKTDEVSKVLYNRTREADKKIVDRVNELAKRRSLPPAQIALAWVLHQPVVTSPIIGASKPGHLETAIAALEVQLSPEERKFLEEIYVPHAVVGFA
jgi:aryl-alcohol dehydrogenase-like predicted oxidoreductase